jgi:hypothetical protein
MKIFPTPRESWQSKSKLQQQTLFQRKISAVMHVTSGKGRGMNGKGMRKNL